VTFGHSLRLSRFAFSDARAPGLTRRVNETSPSCLQPGRISPSAPSCGKQPTRRSQWQRRQLTRSNASRSRRRTRGRCRCGRRATSRDTAGGGPEAPGSSLFLVHRAALPRGGLRRLLRRRHCRLARVLRVKRRCRSGRARRAKRRCRRSRRQRRRMVVRGQRPKPGSVLPAGTGVTVRLGPPKRRRHGPHRRKAR
jgi:hypothetical protein